MANKLGTVRNEYPDLLKTSKNKQATGESPRIYRGEYLPDRSETGVQAEEGNLRESQIPGHKEYPSFIS
ncbi:MAG: hypothetical protein CSB06_03295 [Bacteroidia bacterium]|nr:MAG: hypothetical protein CSB06_03295 [Bacteroidia bacterium]